MPWTKVNQSRGRLQSPSTNVGFQQGGTFLRIPQSCLARAIGSAFTVKKPILIQAYVDGTKLKLKPAHGDYSPNASVRKQQRKSMLKAWKSNPTSKQYYVSAGSILRALEMAPKDVDGNEYRTRVSAGNIVVSIGRGAL